MKKLIALLLILIMCLSISACGEKADETAPKETIPETTGNENVATEEDTETEGGPDDPEIEALKSLITGEWICIDYYDGSDENKTMDFNEDGSVTVNGTEQLKWEIFESTEETTSIRIGDNENTVYTAKLQFSTGGYDNEYYNNIPSMLISKNTSSGTGKNWFSYFKSSQFTSYEITNENCLDFFEIKEFSTVEKDPFGEVTKISVGRYIVLKEEYSTVNAFMSQVFIEYSSKQIKYSITADKTTGEYTIGDVVDPHDNWSANKQTMNTTHTEADGAYGIHIGTSYVTQFPTCEIDIRDNVEVTRATGVLYVFNTAE